MNLIQSYFREVSQNLTSSANVTDSEFFRYIPVDDRRPSEKQRQFLSATDLELFYGGAAGGGKSEALLMGAVGYFDATGQWINLVEMEGYAALILRRTFPQLAKPGAIMDRAKDWFQGLSTVDWNERDKVFRFPGGGKIAFGYLLHEKDVNQYDSSEFQYIGLDEATQLTPYQYRYMFSRLRRKAGSNIPIRMRPAGNPGGISHEFLKARFIKPGTEGRIYIPALIRDNPGLDEAEYLKSLDELDDVTKQRLRDGDWDVAEAGEKFQRHWFEIIERDAVPRQLELLRFWDLAGTKPSKDNPDPDWTRGVKMGRSDEGIYYIIDLQSLRDDDAEVQKLVKQTAFLDGRDVPIIMEEEPGSSGKAISTHYRRHVLDGFSMDSERATGSKWDRATPFATRSKAGDVKIVRADWNDAMLNEFTQFRKDDSHAHDDIIDVCSGAYNKLSEQQPLEVGHMPAALADFRG